MNTKFIFFLSLAVIFVSCSIEKRHYREGFYIERNRANNSIVAKKDSTFQNISIIPAVEIKTLHPYTTSQELATFPIRKNIPVEKKRDFVAEKITPVTTRVPIDTPKEPFNKKAKAAIVFYVLAKLVMVAAFVVLLCSLLMTFFLLTGIAALFALLAVGFGLWAKKEINAREPYERELGGKEAGEVVLRATGGLVSAGFIILLAVIIDWIQRRNGR